ncbi:MAG: hypothetical protein ACOC4I_05535 [Spirochaetota bacterium]
MRNVRILAALVFGLAPVVLSGQFFDPVLSLHLGAGYSVLATSEYDDYEEVSDTFRFTGDADLLYVLGSGNGDVSVAAGGSYRYASPYEGLTMNVFGATGAMLINVSETFTQQVQFTVGNASLRSTIENEASPETGSGLYTELKIHLYAPIFPITDLGSTGTVFLAPGFWTNAGVMLGGLLDPPDDTATVTPLTDTLTTVSVGLGLSFVLVE